MNRVLDACAMIAYLRDRNEEGAELVERILLDSQSRCFAHSVNIAEVFKEYFALDGEEAGEEAVGRLITSGIEIREDMDAEFCRDLARWMVKFKMPFPDAIALTLAVRLSADVVTGDHKDFDQVSNSNTYSICFVR